MNPELLKQANAAFVRHNAEFDDAYALTALTRHQSTNGAGVLLVQLHENLVRCWMVSDTGALSEKLKEILDDKEEPNPDERITDYIRLHSASFAEAIF